MPRRSLNRQVGRNQILCRLDSCCLSFLIGYGRKLTQQSLCIRGFDYDYSGNRSGLDYYLSGSLNGDITSVNYTYNHDNLLTGYSTTGGPTFSFDALDSGNIDGLGRLINAAEMLTKPDNSTIAHSLTFDYDSLSQLKHAYMSRIDGMGYWNGDYVYYNNGDMNSRTITGSGQINFTYNGNEMRTIEANNLSYDENGNLTTGRKDANTIVSLAYNWDNKLRSASVDGNSISVKYDPAGNRIQKNSTVNGDRKYIVDVVGDLPVILLELDSADMSVKKGYIYANSEILAEHDGGTLANEYYYMHDRLGSVRQVISSTGAVIKMFTFNPFGEKLEEQGEFYTPWQFTGQYLDSETGQYYLRARQYSPYLSRFTGRDLIMPDFNEPLTLHRYLYCQNDSINWIDPTGLDKYIGFEYGHMYVGVDV